MVYSLNVVEGVFSEIGAEKLHPAQTDQDPTALKRKAGPLSWEGDLREGVRLND